MRNRVLEIFLTAADEQMYGQVLQEVLKATESKHGVFGYVDEDGSLVLPSLTRDVWEQCRVPEKDIRIRVELIDSSNVDRFRTSGGRS